MDDFGRRLILATGDRQDCLPLVARQLRQLRQADRASVLWVANDPGVPGIRNIRSDRFAAYLGSEWRLLVFDAHQGLHPDALAALVGTLRGGGDCVVLAPPLAAWPDRVDPDQARFAAYPHTADDMGQGFLERLVRLWRTHPGVEVVTPDATLALRLAPPPAAAVALTPEQADAVEAVRRVALGHARRPLVLSADRGRGKSTLLGVAAARLLLDGLPRITVVAAHRYAAATLFAHARATAGLEGEGVADSGIGSGRLCFRLPSDCLASPDEALGLVLVDEAAAVPVAVLEGLLRRSNRLVFASTVHGYEGSGRGFELRFRERLSRAMPQWRERRLTSPVRWSADDPLEQLVNRSFLLDTDLVEFDPAAGIEPVSIEAVGVAQLLADEALLRALFGLLVNAHYQTRPSDLRQLLDNPDVRLWVASQGVYPVGVLLGVVEGGFDPAMAAQILAGRRRPRGHLLPQSLAVHAGLEDILTRRLVRVQRIAVHPACRRQGLASRMLEAAAAWAPQAGCDLLGCAYGVERPLLRFWRAVGFGPVRCGVRIDPASATHSLLMLRGLDRQAAAFTAAAERRFKAQLPWSLGASLNALDSALGAELLRGRDCSDLALDAVDRRALQRIAQGARQPASAEALIWKALVQLAAAGQVAPERLAPLLAWQLQHQDPQAVCRTYARRGRRDLERDLRGLLGDL